MCRSLRELGRTVARSCIIRRSKSADQVSLMKYPPHTKRFAYRGSILHITELRIFGRTTDFLAPTDQERQASSQRVRVSQAPVFMRRRLGVSNLRFVQKGTDKGVSRTCFGTRGRTLIFSFFGVGDTPRSWKSSAWIPTGRAGVLEPWPTRRRGARTAVVFVHWLFG